MRNGFASAALLCTVASPASLNRRALVTSAAMRAQGRSPFEPFRRDLPRIPELLPVRSTRTADIYESTIQGGMASILPGFQTPIYGYEGIYPGPTIRARHGREVILRQRNALAFESNVHLHGGSVPAAHDGHPMDVIPAGGQFEYHYPNRPGRRDALVPRPCARAHVADALLRPAGDVRARGRPRARARPSDAATTTCRS